MEAEATPTTGAPCSAAQMTASTTTGALVSCGAQLPTPSSPTKNHPAAPTPSPPAQKQRAIAGVPGPDLELEVIRLSPRTLLATNRRYPCEVCGKGFQREQNMLLHRRGHNLPWKLKQKDPLQAQRRRVYLCPEPTCVHHDPSRALGDLTRIKKHYCRKHVEKRWRCDRCGERYAVQSDWKAHSKSCGTREFRCDCGTLFSRRDSFITHRAFCGALDPRIAQESAKTSAEQPRDLLFHGGLGVISLQEPALGTCPDKASRITLSSDASSGVSSSPEISDQQQFALSATSSSSSFINKQELVEVVEVDKHKETISRVDYDNHGAIVSRASEKHDIMEFIMSHGPRNKRLITILCIVGAQGLGKTTLTSLVYWDNAVCRSFEARAWMYLSDVCDYEGLLRSLVESLTGVSCRLSERDELEELVREELMGKKFLLVLDDLHESNAEISTHLTTLLNVGEKGSAVMVTTNNDMVLGHFGTAYAYYLKPIVHHEFLNMATPDFVDWSPLESVINKISSQRSGFPMFAKAIHGILYSAFTRGCLDDTVESELMEIFSKPDNHLHSLLDFSYSYLSANQRMCFLYCTMFPRDYIYNKAKLLRLWMSQGLIVPEKEKDGHGKCEDDFDELLRRSFFDHCPSSKLNEQKYVMHEFSPHIALSASGNKFFRAHDHELHCIPQDVRHLSVIPGQFDSEIYFSSFTEFRELSTLLLVCKSQLESIDSQFHVMDAKALDECFRNFRCLKTLDLSHTDLRELPESIGDVTSLCFLGLNNTNLRGLPDSICNLFNLQTLELKNSAFLVELPTDIKNLTSLCHLDASKEHGTIYVPPGIGQLTNLQTLTTFTVGGVSWNCTLSELAHLNSLKGCLHIQSLNNVENAKEAKRACLATKKLKKLSLEWYPSGEEVESDDRIYASEHVLDALKPHLLLEELSIKGYYGLKFPSWIADYTLSDLISITLDNCYNCVKLPALGSLPVLRCLFIQNLRGVKVITSEFCATGIITSKSFPKLEILKLRDMYNLEGWYDILSGDFPLLHSLSIERCPNLNSIPRFQFVSEMTIMSCSKMNLLGLQSLQTLKVGYLKYRKCFALQFELPSLLMLEFICCEHLCSLDGLSRLPSLKHLKFRSCPRINFDKDAPLPGTLETVSVHSNCNALGNWQPNGFEELPDASEVYRKFIRQKCEDKRVGVEMVQKPCRDGSLGGADNGA